MVSESVDLKFDSCKYFEKRYHDTHPNVPVGVSWGVVPWSDEGVIKIPGVPKAGCIANGF